MVEQSSNLIASQQKKSPARTVTPYQWYVTLTATAGFALVSMDGAFFTQALTPLATEFRLSVSTVGWLVVIMQLVAGLATYGVGALMDRAGRRRAFQLTLAATALGSVLTALSWGLVSLGIFRSFANAAGSAEGVTGQTMVAETGVAPRRGFLMAVQQAGYPIGWFLASGLALIVLPTLGWRALFLIGVIPALLAMLARLWVKESDRFTDMRQVREQVAELNATVDSRYAVDTSRVTESLFRQLFERDLVRTSVILFLATFFFAVGSGTVLFFVPYLTDARGLTNHQLNEVVAIGTIGGFVGYLLQGWIGDFVGRKHNIIVTLILGSVAIFFLSRSTTFATIAISEIFFWLFYMGAYAALYGFLTESFPTRIRGTGVGFVTAGVWIGNAVSGAIAPHLQSATGVPNAFVWGGFVPGLIAAVLFMFAKATRPGAELEQIAR
jgi:MFS transporter, putative metabolite:H+ symporter